MNITWHGQSAFKIQEKELTIAIDPFENAGVKLTKFQADIVLLTPGTMKEKEVKNVKGEPFFITDPGEYEVKNVFVYGVGANRDEEKPITMYLLEIGGVKIGHLGGLTTENLTEKQRELFEECDVLLVPVGGGSVMDGATAAKLVNKIQPRIVIPMYYKTAGITEKLESAEAFIKELGLKAEEVDKAKITKKELPIEEMKLMVIKKS